MGVCYTAFPRAKRSYILEGFLSQDQLHPLQYNLPLQTRPVSLYITKDLWSSNQRKEALATFLAAKLIECKNDSQTTYAVNSKGGCMASTIGDKLS